VKGRVFRRLFLLLLAGLGLVWPALFSGTSQGAPVDDPVTITSLRADFTVDRDGLMQATETVTAEFPSGRHGIFRFWDISNPNDAHVRQTPDVLDITLDGQSVPYDMLTREKGRIVVAKIGDPDSYLLPGSHVYRIRYTVPGVLDPGPTGDGKTFASAAGEARPADSVFFWNVIARWNNRIDQAQVTNTLPGAVPGAQCSVATDTKIGTVFY
jgi:hypothetical protein